MNTIETGYNTAGPAIYTLGTLHIITEMLIGEDPWMNYAGALYVLSRTCKAIAVTAEPELHDMKMCVAALTVDNWRLCAFIARDPVKIDRRITASIVLGANMPHPSDVVREQVRRIIGREFGREDMLVVCNISVWSPVARRPDFTIMTTLGTISGAQTSVHKYSVVGWTVYDYRLYNYIRPFSFGEMQTITYEVGKNGAQCIMHIHLGLCTVAEDMSVDMVEEIPPGHSQPVMCFRVTTSGGDAPDLLP